MNRRRYMNWMWICPKPWGRPHAVAEVPPHRLAAGATQRQRRAAEVTRRHRTAILAAAMFRRATREWDFDKSEL